MSIDSEQAASNQGEPAPRTTDRIFFATYPSADVGDRIAKRARAFIQEHGLKAAATCASRLHVTLHYLGDHVGLPADIVKSARAAASAVETACFDVAFDEIRSFPRHRGKKPLVLCGGSQNLHALIEFQANLGRALAEAGLARWVERSFTPHVTLQYANRELAPQSTEPVGWTVREFALVHSLLGQHRHEVLGRWSLHG